MKYYIIVLTFLFLNQNILAQNNSEIAEKYFLQADSLVDAEHYKKAIVLLDSAIKYDAENAEFYALKGFCLFNTGDFFQALESFDLALILEDAYAEVYYLRGMTKLELNQEKKACEDFVEAYLLGMKEAMDFIEKICNLEELEEINE